MAYEIGFGEPRSETKALGYLLQSAQLGNPDARREVFGTYRALSFKFPEADLGDLKQWLGDAALNGDKICLEELGNVDISAHDEVLHSKDRSRKMCERSGIILDDSFFQTNDLSDVPGLIAAIRDSGEAVDCDIGGGMTWLHYAAYGGSLEFAVQLVQELHAPVNVRNCKGQTPLWIACLGGNYEVTRFLLGEMADASLTSDYGLNPLHHLPAFANEHVFSIATLLRDSGANPDAQARNGMTPLHYAISGSAMLVDEPGVGALLSLGANPLLPDEDGDTAIHTAIFSMHISYLERMLNSDFVKNLEKPELLDLLAKAFRDWVLQIKHHRLRRGSHLYLERVAHLTKLLHTNETVSSYISTHPLGCVK